MAQAAGGFQVTYNIPGSDGHLSLFVQVQGSATAGSPSTGDAQGSFGLQYAF